MDCRAFGRLAENINKYLTKGRPIFVEGRLTFDSWTAQDGTKRSKHRVTVENFQFLPGAAERAEQSVGDAPASDRGGSDLGPEQQRSADDIPF